MPCSLSPRSLSAWPRWSPPYQTIAYIVSALGILLIFSAKHFGAVIDNAIYSKIALTGHVRT